MGIFIIGIRSESYCIGKRAIKVYNDTERKTGFIIEGTLDCAVLDAYMQNAYYNGTKFIGTTGDLEKIVDKDALVVINRVECLDGKDRYTVIGTGWSETRLLRAEQIEDVINKVYKSKDYILQNAYLYTTETGKRSIKGINWSIPVIKEERNRIRYATIQLDGDYYTGDGGNIILKSVGVDGLSEVMLGKLSSKLNGTTYYVEGKRVCAKEYSGDLLRTLVMKLHLLNIRVKVLVSKLSNTFELEHASNKYVNEINSIKGIEYALRGFNANEKISIWRWNNEELLISIAFIRLIADYCKVRHLDFKVAYQVAIDISKFGNVPYTCKFYDGKILVRRLK